MHCTALPGPLPFIVSICLLFAGCARVYVWHEHNTVRPDALAAMQAELNAVAETDRITTEELVIRFPEVALFDVGEYVLRAPAKEDLEGVAKILNRYPEFIVIVEGYTDSNGPEGFNQWLSERRSRVVADFLVNEGLDPYKIQVVGYGETRPLLPNDTPEGRRRNRRVELHIIPMQP